MADISRVATHTWVNDAVPAVNGAHLNEIETDLDAVFAQANAARSIASDTAAVAVLTDDPRVAPSPTLAAAGKVVTVKSDGTGYELDTPSGGGGGSAPTDNGDGTFTLSPITGYTKAGADTQLSGKVSKSTLAAKGDLYVATGSGAVARLAVGSNGQVLTADSTQTAGVKYATPSSGGAVSGLPSYAPTGLTKTWDNSQAVHNPRPANLHAWTAKLAKAACNAASLHVGFAGDSLLIGYDGSGYDRDRALPRRFGFDTARMLGNPYVTTGVTLAKTSIADLGDRWTLTGTWTASGANCLQGTTAGTATWVTPDQCTNAEIYYHNASVGFTYTVDGGSPVTVTPTGASTIGKIALSGLTYGFHTIVLTFAASGAIVCGQRCWTPALNQIHVHNIALGGSRANGGSGQQNWSNTSTLAPTGLGWMAPAMLTSAGVTLDAVFIEAGDNDIYSGGEDAPTTITGLTTMHSYFSSVPTFLVRPYCLPGTVSATADALAGAMMTLAESIDAVFCSWDEIVGRSAGAVADGLLGADNLHPTFPHQQLAAAYLAGVAVQRSYADAGRWIGVVGQPGGRWKVIEAAGTYPPRPNAPAGWVDYVGADQPGDWLDGDTWDDLP